MYKDLHAPNYYCFIYQKNHHCQAQKFLIEIFQTEHCNLYAHNRVMSVSMEALAMAGADCYEWGMDVEEWEREDIELEPPPHLLADEEEKKNI